MRARFAAEPADRFAQAIEDRLALIDRLPDETVRAILADLEATRRQVLAELVTAQGLGAVRLQALDQRLQDVMASFVEHYGQTVAPAQGAAWDAGVALGARPLIEAGVLFHVPQISRRLLEVMQGYQAALITGESARTVADISTALRAGLLRGDSMFETAQQVAGSLDGPGPFGSLAVRAEAITRTELGRLQAAATQASLTAAAEHVPDLQKEWRHSDVVGKWVRLGHLEAHGQVQDVDAPFSVAPGPGYAAEDLMYPRDPAGSARNTVNCRCVNLPFVAAWAEAEAQAA